MDPITAIFAALAAGAAAAAKDTASAAVKDGYEGLKQLLRKKFTGRVTESNAVDAHAIAPEKAEEILRPAMKEVAADRDDELIAAAKALLESADDSGAVRARYALTVEGDVQGLVQGNHNRVNMNFGRN
jgi:hypothetical protein